MHPVLYDFGAIHLFGMILPVKIYTYGTLMAIAFMLGMYVASRQARALGLPDDWPYDLGIYILIATIVGARLFYALCEDPATYFHDPLRIFYLNQGGLVFYGGFIFAGAYLVIHLYFSQRAKIWPWLDTAMIAALAGHAVGRISCFLNGDSFGQPSNLPWAIKLPVLGDNIPRHPTQIYELMAYALIFLILLLRILLPPRD